VNRKDSFLRQDLTSRQAKLANLRREFLASRELQESLHSRRGARTPRTQRRPPARSTLGRGGGEISSRQAGGRHVVPVVQAASGENQGQATGSTLDQDDLACLSLGWASVANQVQATGGIHHHDQRASSFQVRPGTAGRAAFPPVGLATASGNVPPPVGLATASGHVLPPVGLARESGNVHLPVESEEAAARFLLNFFQSQQVHTQGMGTRASVTNQEQATGSIHGHGHIANSWQGMTTVAGQTGHPPAIQHAGGNVHPPVPPGGSVAASENLCGALQSQQVHAQRHALMENAFGQPQGNIQLYHGPTSGSRGGDHEGLPFSLW